MSVLVEKPYNRPYLWVKSFPDSDDSDGDGLLDGKARYVNGKKIAPMDTLPLTPNLSNVAWGYHITLESLEFAATDYLNNQVSFGLDIDQNVADFLVSMILPLRNGINENGDNLRELALQVKNVISQFGYADVVGAYFLNFVRDDKWFAYHSQNDTWQRKFGYNELYDDLFRIDSNMDRMPLRFNNGDGKEYVLWAWKGDYWCLNSGAEIGLYVNDPKSDDISTEETIHYSAVDFEVPMTLSLYNYEESDDNIISIKNIFSWNPAVPQWWITGFNSRPEYANPDPEKLAVIGTVDFSQHKDLFFSLKDSVSDGLASKYKDYVILDEEDFTVWIIWH